MKDELSTVKKFFKNVTKLDVEFKNVEYKDESTARASVFSSNGDYQLSHCEVQSFMDQHGYDQEEFAILMGVTVQAVRLWIMDQRRFSVTNTRLLKMFERYPKLMGEFR